MLQPAADEARLSNWFSLVKVQAELFGTAGAQLKAGDKGGAQRTISKLYSNLRATLRSQAAETDRVLAEISAAYRLEADSPRTVESSSPES